MPALPIAAGKSSRHTSASRRVWRFVLIPILIVALWGGGQRPTAAAPLPPAEVASYTLDARYDPDTFTITASGTARYHNHSTAPISDVVLHLYLNAFRSAETQWMIDAGPAHRGFAFAADHPASITLDQAQTADGTPLTFTAVDPDATLVRAELPTAVQPGETLVLEIAFTAQLPRVFARTGWADEGQFVMAGQWFPKFGVWEEGAWTAHPFRVNNEFYANFGTYEIALTLPADWVVGATGTQLPTTRHNEDGTTTHLLRAEHVIDFAWAASPRFRQLERTIDGVSVRVLYYAGERRTANRVLEATIEGLSLYSAWYGPYGQGLYPYLTVILTPADAGGAGGMEYPTLFTVGALGGLSLPRCIRLLEVETLHELGHQWFQSVVATNEAEEPWLDEGFTDYITTRAIERLYDGGLWSCGGWRFSYLATQRAMYQMQPRVPMAGAAWEFDTFDYAIATYAKPAVALTTLERLVGEEAMLHFMQTYYGRYAFVHPNAEDVYRTMAETLGEPIAAWFFEQWVHGSETLDARVRTFDPGGAGIVLEREGEACFPTTVRVTRKGEGRADVQVTDDLWSCEEPIWASTDSDIVQVEIDPDLDLLIDLNLANNSRSRRVEVAEGLGILVRILRLLQSLFWGGAAW